MKCELQKNFIVEAKIVAFCTLFIRVRRKALSPKAYPSTTRCRSRGVCHAVAKGYGSFHIEDRFIGLWVFGVEVGG